MTEHIDRLFDTCKLVAINPRFDREQVSKACVDLIRANKLDEAYLRPLIYLGAGAMGVYAPNNPIRTTIIAWKWGAYLGTHALDKGVKTKISAWVRHHPSISLAKGKIMGQYTNSILAKREAKISGYDEAILMDHNGNVCEGSSENLFIVKNGEVITPPLIGVDLELASRARPSSQLALEEGLTVRDRHISRDQLYLADEAFFTGTAVEVTPVIEVDDRSRRRWQVVGPITKKLQDRYFDVVKGTDDSHPEWLTFI